MENQPGGSICEAERDSDGQVSILLPSTAGTVHVWYEGLPWFHLTDLASWFSCFVFLYMVYRTWQRRML